MTSSYDKAKGALKTLRINTAADRIKVDIAERLRERDVNVSGGFPGRDSGVDEM